MAGRKPGTPKTGGRQKGTTNKVTALAKDAIAAAADRLGGVDRLVQWVREDSSNERVFWGQIYTKRYHCRWLVIPVNRLNGPSVKGGLGMVRPGFMA